MLRVLPCVKLIASRRRGEVDLDDQSRWRNWSERCHPVAPIDK